MASYETVEEPIPFPQAFHETGDAAAQSQAAVLLTLGALLHYEEPQTHDALSIVMAPPLRALDILPEEEREAMNLPREMLFQLRANRGMRFDSYSLQEYLGAENIYAGPLEAAELSLAVMPKLADRLAESPEPLVAASLCEAGLAHPDPLVRVAAASAYTDVAMADQQARAVQILIEGTYSDDPLVRDLAATALSRVLPGHPRLIKLMQPVELLVEGEPSFTSTIIHGTLARGYPWWQPGGGFHSYLKTTVDPDLYSASDRFDWSGLFSDAARALGALDLVGWVDMHGLQGLDLFTHSHGGSVAMLASKARMQIGRLVLLSCPVYVPKYEPNFSVIGKVVSIRVKMDLVILAGLAGQRFRDPRIQEIVLPIWFKHSVTHEPQTWIDHDLPKKI